jgi:hypothetical protein
LSNSVRKTLASHSQQDIFEPAGAKAALVAVTSTYTKIPVGEILQFMTLPIYQVLDFATLPMQINV